MHHRHARGPLTRLLTLQRMHVVCLKSFDYFFGANSARVGSLCVSEDNLEQKLSWELQLVMLQIEKKDKSKYSK